MGDWARPPCMRGLHVELLQDLHTEHHIPPCKIAKRHILLGPLASVEIKAVEEDVGVEENAHGSRR